MWGSCLCCMLLLLLLLLHSFLYMFGGSVVRCAHRACMSTRSRARSETTYLRLYVCMLVCPVQVVLAHSIICHYEYSDPHCAAYHCPWFVIKRSHFDSCFILPFFFCYLFFFSSFVFATWWAWLLSAVGDHAAMKWYSCFVCMSHLCGEWCMAICIWIIRFFFHPVRRAYCSADTHKHTNNSAVEATGTALVPMCH